MPNDVIITRLERIIDLIRDIKDEQIEGRCQEGKCICHLFDKAIESIKVIESKF